MANSTRRCSWKQCRASQPVGTMIVKGSQAWCNSDHQYKHALDALGRLRKRKAKEEKQKHTKRKRTFYDNDIKTRKAAAVKEFNAYIRARDDGKGCISCQRPIPADDYCAGHYIPAGSNSLLKFDEFNVNGQHNNDCNKHRSGDQVRYRIGLIAKYGIAEVERLESTNGTIKRKPQDYKAIEVKYREKRLQLNQEERT